jgi:hypothetical protein
MEFEEVLEAETVRELLDYNPETGILVWKERDWKWFNSKINCKRWNARFAGKPALNNPKKGYGYLCGTILGKSCSAHRVIWLWMTGRWPNPEVDHKNRNPSDNRWRNLREATHAEGARNRSLSKYNTSGFNGVGMWPATHKASKKYRAQIRVNNHILHLGSFDTFEEARRCPPCR